MFKKLLKLFCNNNCEKDFNLHENKLQIRINFLFQRYVPITVNVYGTNMLLDDFPLKW